MTKKEIRAVIIAGPEIIGQLHTAMALAFGKDNVACSFHPKDLFGLLKKMNPLALIIDPLLFHQAKIPPEDINAYRKNMHYRILAVYPTEESLAVREEMHSLNITKEYVKPTEFLTMIGEIPRLCTNRYVKVKQPLIENTTQNLERIFTECGFHCNTKGAPLIKEALFMMYFDQKLHYYGGGAKIFRELGEKYGYTPRIVERSIIRFLEASWNPITEKKFRAELNIPDSRPIEPLSFGNFTMIFDTYYSIKYGMAEKILKYPRNR